MRISINYLTNEIISYKVIASKSKMISTSSTYKGTYTDNINIKIEQSPAKVKCAHFKNFDNYADMYV